jgi:hypothetical protein
MALSVNRAAALARLLLDRRRVRLLPLNRGHEFIDHEGGYLAAKLLAGCEIRAVQSQLMLFAFNTC